MLEKMRLLTFGFLISTDLFLYLGRLGVIRPPINKLGVDYSHIYIYNRIVGIRISYYLQMTGIY